MSTTSKKTSSRLGGTIHYSIHGIHRAATSGSNVPLLRLELHSEKRGEWFAEDNTPAGRQWLQSVIQALNLPQDDAKYLCDLVAAASSRAAL
jgi:hypothetical protein